MMTLKSILEISEIRNNTFKKMVTFLSLISNANSGY
jgi:hypothetical protein